jgi:hypothetical protein
MLHYSSQFLKPKEVTPGNLFCLSFGDDSYFSFRRSDECILTSVLQPCSDKRVPPSTLVSIELSSLSK